MTSPVSDGPAGVSAIRSRAGFAASGPYAAAEVTGPDAAAFLDAQLPCGVNALDPGEGVYSAYLDRKGRITHDFFLFRHRERFLFLLRRELLTSFLEKLDRYHIRENLQMRDLSGETVVMEIHGPAVPRILTEAAGARVLLDAYRATEIQTADVPVLFFSNPWTGDVGGQILVPQDKAGAVAGILHEAGNAHGMLDMDDEMLETLRIEGGTPRVGVDILETTLLVELDREGMVSLDKGCFLGQETVARVLSRGRVSRVLLGLAVEGDRVPPPGTLVHLDETPVGETRSACWSPSLGSVAALVSLRSQAADPGAVVHLNLDSRWIPARVRELPLYHPPGPETQAESLYRKGLEEFKQDRYREALSLFEKAVLMNPRHVDAFESMGICQDRLGDLDQAVETMKSLTEMEPDHVMAWTNLSRYYAQMGMIEEAEKVKGHVTYLVWKKEAGEMAAARKVEEEEAARKARLADRVDLFKQVLAMDPEDVVANFGLGKILLDLERYEEAVPCFQKAIEGKKHYSMAYNHMGTCLAALGRTEEAVRAFQEGIRAATEKGDFIPKRDMSRKLEQLKQTKPNGG